MRVYIDFRVLAKAVETLAQPSALGYGSHIFSPYFKQKWPEKQKNKYIISMCRVTPTACCTNLKFNIVVASNNPKAQHYEFGTSNMIQ